MRLHPKKGLRTVQALPALLLALLLCACSNSQTPSVSATLPAIGIGDLVPGTTRASQQGSTEAPAPSSENVPESGQPAETTEAAETETAEAVVPTEPENTEEPTDPPTEPATTAQPTKKSDSGGYRVWIGDSRFVGIRDTVSCDPDRDFFIAAWGAAYYWMVNTAVPTFEAFTGLHKVDAVYWCLGAGDITKILTEQNFAAAEKYADVLDDLIYKYPDIDFYVLSYGPIGGDGKSPSDITDPEVYNLSIQSFTGYVLSHSRALYIDQAGFLEESGYATTDGRHYDAATNQRIYDYVLAQSGQ